MKDEGARAVIAASVSRETLDRLDTYAAALEKWQRAINLVSPASVAHLWGRHFLDSAQVFPLRHTDEGLWLDIGSGGGFPGLVCAILAAEAAPDLRFTLIESDLRKCSFLRDVARQTGVAVCVLTTRVEDALPQDATIISARAVTSVPRLCDMAYRHLAPRGICLFLKGENHAKEMEEANKSWKMKAEAVPSETAPGAVIFKIGELARV